MIGYPLRIGTTSYIVEDDLVANARFLAGKVSDMQLVLFELPNGPSNIPSPATVAELAHIGLAANLTYSVHLIDDLVTADRQHPTLRRCQRLIELFAPLQPSAYVLHLDGRAVREANFGDEEMRLWQPELCRALQQLAEWTGEGKLLAVENLEGYPPELVAPVVERADVSRCVDVGHLWLDGVDPLPSLQATRSRARMIHLHGLNEGRDHQSLAHLPAAQIDAVVHWLLATKYSGLVTLEIFGEADFVSSLRTLSESIGRCI